MEKTNQILSLSSSISKDVQKEAIKLLLGGNNWGMTGIYIEKGYPVYYIDIQLLTYLGFSYEEFIQKVDGNFLNAIYEEDRKRVEKVITQQLESDNVYNVNYRIITKENGYIWVNGSGGVAVSYEGKMILTSIIMDLNLQLENEEAQFASIKSWEKVERKTKFFQSLYESIGSGILQLIDDNGLHILNANDSTFELLGYTREEFATLFQNQIVRVVHPEDYDNLIHVLESIEINSTQKMEYRILTKGNLVKWVHAEISKLKNEEDAEIMQVVFIDITDLKNIKLESENTIKEKVVRDELTNFYTKLFGEEKIRLYLLNKSEEETCELLIIDMDNFTVINDTYGVMFGNVLLKEVTELVEQYTRKEDILVRSGGDELLVLLTNSSREESTYIASEICKEVKRVYTGEKREINMSCSIGIAGTIFTEEYEELHNRAIIALEYAKQVNVGGYMCYHDTISVISSETKEEFLSKHYVREINGNEGETEQDMISFAFSLLEKSKDLPSAINLLLSRIGKQYNLERVSVTEIDLDYLSLQYIYQWSRDTSLSTTGKIYYISKNECIWFDSRFEGKYDKVSSCVLPDEHHLKSCLQSPIYDKGIYKGSVCFEKNIDEYLWSDDIKRLLKEISKIISTYTLKVKADSVSKAKTDFLSRMSHEIRTPMNAIYGMANIAKKSIDNPQKVEDCLDKIEYSTKYLVSLVNNILDMSKIESGKITILKQGFDLSGLIHEVDVIMRSPADVKNLDFRIEENYKNHILIGDELRLSQVLVNIIGNAIKFTEDYGSVVFKVEQVGEGDNRAEIRFSIKDSGIGIREENINRIFNSFEQAESSIVREYGGTGLGLSISSNLVNHMGGTLEVKSVYKEGSEFFFTLPFELGDAMNIQCKEHSNEQRELFDFSGKKILVVEDNSLNMEIERTLLEMNGCIVEEAKNGQEAVELFIEKPSFYYDLILMDIRMPIMDGLEATKLIRTSNREDARVIPIIATTANAFDEDTKKSMESGMDGHISKPIEVKCLFEMVNRAIRSRKASR